MESFTAMSDEGIQAVIRAKLKRMNFNISFNDRDFAMLMYALKLAWEHGDQLGEWAGSFASAIAEVNEIEFV